MGLIKGLSMKKILILLAIMSISACSSDPNDEPKYGDSGLPSNCRSYIQVSVDAWRAGEYATEETMNALERNCGVYGQLWDE